MDGCLGEDDDIGLLYQPYPGLDPRDQGSYMRGV